MQDNSKQNNASASAKAGSYVLDAYTAEPPRSYATGGEQEEESPYYKPSAPAISLPKGGGALKGIDEKFTVNAVNGTAALEIALPLTPGRGGFTPALSLSYSSGSGNSAFGLGWSMSLPSIQRKTDKKLPLYNDSIESDVFILAGAEDLVPELDGSGAPVVITTADYIIRRYRPRIEGLYARIERVIARGSDGACWWRVSSKENITTWYGLDASSIIADPEEPARIFAWFPVLSIDHKGNAQQYSYMQENTDNVAPSAFEKNRLDGTAKFTNTYLKKVSYGNVTPYFISGADVDVFAPQLPLTDWMFEAVLDYGDHTAESPAPDIIWPSRNDAFSDYRAGFEIRTYRLCRRVLMFHAFEGLKDGAPALVRSLELTYRNDNPGLPPGALTETDYITAAVQRGYQWRQDENEDWYVVSKALPPLTLDYIPLQWDDSIHQVSREDFSGAPQGLTGPYQWTDFEGEGISGILVEQDSCWHYKNNLGDGHFSPSRSIALKPGVQGLGSVLQWQDLDADGSRQVTIEEAGLKGYWELDPAKEAYPAEGSWQPFQPFEKYINIDWNSPYTLRLDLDGDGRADTLIADDLVWTWYANKGREGHDSGGQTGVYHDEEKGPVLLLRDNVQSIFMADMSGDGLTDLVRICNGEVCYWPNKGYGRFGAKVTMAGAPVFRQPDIYNPLYLSLADISGTGAADLIYTGTDKLVAWINNAGNGFGEGYTINPLPATDPYSKITVTDFLGNGTGCIVWSSPLPQHSDAPIQYIDLMGGHKPYLLEKYSNGTGKEINLEYQSSTRYYLNDKKQGIRWATRLPFPVHCVSKVTTHDTASETTYTQSYRYRHGYYDSPEREFRGFGYVETLDTDQATVNSNSLDQAPVLTKTWYHTGAWLSESTLLEQFSKEYFRFESWDDFTEIARLSPGLGWQEFREALRALKGSPLRQEVYAVDATAQADIPYSVTATAYKVLKIQGLPPAASSGPMETHAVFMSLQEQRVVFSCERTAEDPRILHDLVLETDTYGNVLQSAQVAYRRKETYIDPGLPALVKEEQRKTYITLTQNGFTNDAIDNDNYAWYRLRVPYCEKSYELRPAESPQGSFYTVAELLQEADNAAEVDFSDVPDAGEKRLLVHSSTLFLENDGLTVMDPGEIESLALPYERYALAFTDGIIAQYYNTGITRVDDSMLETGGYTDLDNDGNYWLPSGTAAYSDPEDSFYTPQQYSDPWGNTTLVTFNEDSCWLLPESITDALGNVTEITEYDWNTLQPLRMKDANDNVSEMLYDALGMPVAMALKGKDDPMQPEGDTLAGLEPDSVTDKGWQDDFWEEAGEATAEDLLGGATWRCLYDLDSVPAAVAMIAREQHHVISPASAMQVRISYSDGFGRVLMHKAQCEPTLNNGEKEWTASGRTIYNNKGNAVMQYEPYFSSSHHCDTAEQAAAAGVSPKLYYDPLDRVCRTELPDGSYTQTAWTAWEQQVWDNNDTILQSVWYTARTGGGMGPEEQDAAEKAAKHAGTPTIMYLDTLARAFWTIQHNRYMQYIEDEIVWTDQYISGHEQLDISGNRISITDGRDLVALQYRYNMLQAPMQQQSIDSGTQHTLLDVAGQTLYSWDADNRRFTTAYDELRRPLTKAVESYDEIEEEWTDRKVLEVYEYGEGEADDKEKNLRGQVFKIYDGAGVVAMPAYDFKGNPLSQVRTYTEDATQHPDWTTIVSVSLEPESCNTDNRYDALSRPVNRTSPEGAKTSYTYDKGGLLQTVTVQHIHGLDAGVVNNIEYDAKGQRTKIQYENGTTTTYEYDTFTFRVRRIRTTRHSDSAELQDLRYWYDPVGNITLQKDDAQQDVYFDGSVALPHNDYTYDALYRLIRAAGREHAGNNTAPGYNDYDSGRTGINPVPVDSADTAKMRRYRQYYEYDATGNLVKMKHRVAGGTGNWTRYYTTANTSNRLQSTVIGSGTPEAYMYDERGNIISGFIHLQSMAYNAENRLETVVLTADRTAYYQYDSSGQRVRKTIIDTDTELTEMRKYVGEWEIYLKFDSDTLATDTERETLHVSDDTGRILLVDTLLDEWGGVEEQLQRYQYSNHLQSAALELTEAGAVISYEEYYPYGSTSFQAGRSGAEVSLKRYRYTGKERDEETGLYYHGARYYIPWLCRWTATDPLESKYAGMSPYNYSFNNPVVFNDPSGQAPENENTTSRNIVQEKVEAFNKIVDKKSKDAWGLSFEGTSNEVTEHGFAVTKQKHDILTPFPMVSDRVFDEKFATSDSKFIVGEIKSGSNGMISRNEMLHDFNTGEAVGSVHTHPYKQGYLGMPPSAADFLFLLEDNQMFPEGYISMIEAGNQRYAFVVTDRNKADASFERLTNRTSQELFGDEISFDKLDIEKRSSVLMAIKNKVSINQKNIFEDLKNELMQDIDFTQETKASLFEKENQLNRESAMSALLDLMGTDSGIELYKSNVYQFHENTYNLKFNKIR